MSRPRHRLPSPPGFGTIPAWIALAFALLTLLLCSAVVSAALASNIEAGAPHLPGKRTAPAPSAAAELCQTLPWACAMSGASHRVSEDQIALSHRINARINAAVRSVSDRRQYGVIDHWALPTRRGGDCEDFALLKMRDLIAAGLPPERLLIATALDRERRPHAVLILRTQDQDLVLDNLTDAILPWQETGYSFLRIQDPSDRRRWLSVMAGGGFSEPR